MSSPRISVIIAAYNAAETIAETLASVQIQTLAPFEILVVDDGSRDATARIARDLGARVISQQNAGVSAARNRGLAEAQGDWIAFVDADDRWKPERLARQWEGLALAPDAGFAFTDMRRERAGTVVHERWMPLRAAYTSLNPKRPAPGVAVFDRATLSHAILVENFVPASSLLIRRDRIPADGFEPTMRYCEDLELWLRILKNTDAVAIEEPLVIYRLHAASASAQWAKILRGDIELFERVRAHPERYVPGLADTAAAAHAPRARTLGVHCIRIGEYAQARGALLESWRRKKRPDLLGWYALSALLSVPGVKPLHVRARATARRLLKREG